MKLYVTMRLLRFRQAAPEVFDGEYRVLRYDGPVAEGVLGFSRHDARGTLVVVLPRFPARGEPRGEHRTARVVLPEALAGAAATDVLAGTAQVLTAALDLDGLPLPWCVLWKTAE